MVFGWLEEKALGRTGLERDPMPSVSGDQVAVDKDTHGYEVWREVVVTVDMLNDPQGP